MAQSVRKPAETGFSGEQAKLEIVHVLHVSVPNVGGDYCGDNVEIAIVPNKISDENSVAARCECYSRKEHKDGRYYSLKGYYVFPELSDGLYQGFVYQCFDLGAQGSVDENGMQSY